MFDPRDDARDRDGRRTAASACTTSGTRRRPARGPDARPRPAAWRGARFVVDRDHVYELDGEDSGTLAAVGAFMSCPSTTSTSTTSTLEHLHDRASSRQWTLVTTSAG